MQPCAVCLLEQGGWSRWPTVVPSNLVHSVTLRVYVLSPSCQERHKSARNALPGRWLLLRWEWSGGALLPEPSIPCPPGWRWMRREAGPSRPLPHPGSGGSGQHGWGAAVPAPAAPLPAARRCRRQRPAGIQPAPQPGRDVRGQPGQRRAGCARGPSPGGVAAGGAERGRGGLRAGGTHAPDRCFCGPLPPC